ncbi:hypothetical protein [Micromonospora haikouensis]|uniref:hypothetical protein n=1 Tax=Micromonospora haikouensis TaxID=686309 RepID=UPI003D7250B4
MTHPGGGNTGTVGPGRTDATPLTASARVDNYRRQTGRDVLTARQLRRLVHKARRAAVRAS